MLCESKKNSFRDWDSPSCRTKASIVVVFSSFVHHDWRSKLPKLAEKFFALRAQTSVAKKTGAHDMEEKKKGKREEVVERESVSGCSIR